MLWVIQIEFAGSGWAEILLEPNYRKWLGWNIFSGQPLELYLPNRASLKVILFSSVIDCFAIIFPTLSIEQRRWKSVFYNMQVLPSICENCIIFWAIHVHMFWNLIWVQRRRLVRRFLMQNLWTLQSMKSGKKAYWECSQNILKFFKHVFGWLNSINNLNFLMHHQIQ